MTNSNEAKAHTGEDCKGDCFLDCKGAKATPRPWIFEESDLSIRTKDFKQDCGQGDYRGIVIASVDPNEWARGCREDVIPTMKANASLIVRCVNGWDSLVAQRDSLLEACYEARAYTDGKPDNNALNRMYEKMCQAISNAEK